MQLSSDMLVHVKHHHNTYKPTLYVHALAGEANIQGEQLADGLDELFTPEEMPPGTLGIFTCPIICERALC